MDFKKYLNSKMLSESIPNSMLKYAIRGSKSFKSDIDNNLETKVLEAYKKTFGGLNKTIRHPLYINSEHYNSYDFEYSLYNTCIDFANILFQTPRIDVDGNMTKVDTLVRSVGAFFTNCILAFNTKLTSPAVFVIIDGNYEMEHSKTVSSIKSFDVIQTVTIKKESDGIVQDFEKFIEYLNAFKSDSCKIVAKYKQHFNNDTAASYELSYSVVFRTRPRKLDYISIHDFSISKDSAKKQCILIDDKEYNVSKIYLSLIDILTRSCFDIYKHLEKEYNTSAFKSYVNPLMNKVKLMRKTTLENKIDHLLKDYKTALTNYANFDGSSDNIHIYDLIITTNIRDNIAMSMDKSWVSCQTWTQNDLKSAFFGDLVDILNKKLNDDSDIEHIKNILITITKKPYIDRYYQITNIDKFSNEIFKYAKNYKNLSFRTVGFNEILQKYLVICANTSTHSVNPHDIASPNKSLTSWKYIATAYIVNKDEPINKNVLKRITILPFYTKNDNEITHVFYSPLPNLHNIKTGDYKKYWKGYPNIYSEYQKTGFDFDIVIRQCSEIFKEYALANGAIPNTGYHTIDSVAYTGDIKDGLDLIDDDSSAPQPRPQDYDPEMMPF